MKVSGTSMMPAFRNSDLVTSQRRQDAAHVVGELADIDFALADADRRHHRRGAALWWAFLDERHGESSVLD
jgi:hypothetical protein